MAVEYRWLPLLWFTMFQLIISTTISVTQIGEGYAITDMILCTGVAPFNAMQAKAEQNRVFLGAEEDMVELQVDECDPEGEHNPI